MNQHSLPKLILICIAIGSLSILLLTFTITLDIFLAIRFIVAFYGILCLITIVYYVIDQQEIKHLNDYATKTKLYQDRLAVANEAEKVRNSMLPKYESEPSPEDKAKRDKWFENGQVIKESLEGLDTQDLDN